VNESADGNSCTYCQVEGGKEFLVSSSPLGTRKIPLALHQRLQKGIDDLKAVATDASSTQNAKLVAREFKFPDPNRSPELYRYNMTIWKGARLNILWGVEGRGSGSVSAEDVLKVLKTEPVWVTWTKRVLAFWWLLIPLLILWMYLSRPQLAIDIQPSDEIPLGKPAQVILQVTNEKGYEFVFYPCAGDAEVGEISPEPSSGKEIPIRWTSPRGDKKVLLAYGEAGNRDLRFVGKSRFFGIPLPNSEVKKTIKILATAPDHLWDYKQVTPPRQLPAEVNVWTVKEDGDLAIAGFPNKFSLKLKVKQKITFRKAGDYPSTFISDSQKSEVKWIRICGSGSLVAHLRLSKDKVGEGEPVQADTTSSFSEGGGVLKKEISWDGGQTWSSIQDMENKTFNAPGKREIHLRVTDSKGNTETDKESLKVVPDTYAPPVAAIHVSPSTVVDEGTPVTLTLDHAARCPNTKIQSVKLSVDGGVNYTALPCGAASQPVPLKLAVTAQAGDKKIILQVADGKTVSTAEVTLVVTAKKNLPPKIQASAKQYIVEGDLWVIDTSNAQTTDPASDGTIRREISWDEGKTFNPVDAKKEIQGLKVGTHTCIVKVTDQRGNVATERRDVTVEAKVSHPPKVVVNLSKKDVYPKEPFNCDTTNSFPDPESKIVAREYSLDGGKNWVKMTGASPNLTFPDEAFGNKKVMVRVKDEKVRVGKGEADIRIDLSMPSDDLFDSGKHEIKLEGKMKLGKFANLIKNDTVKIKIVGHTDAQPLKPSAMQIYPGGNQELSERRAQAAKDHLVACGIAPDRIVTLGRGAKEPIDPSNHALNRRIEISPMN